MAEKKWFSPSWPKIHEKLSEDMDKVYKKRTLPTDAHKAKPARSDFLALGKADQDILNRLSSSQPSLAKDEMAQRNIQQTPMPKPKTKWNNGVPESVTNPSTTPASPPQVDSKEITSKAEADAQAKDDGAQAANGPQAADGAQAETGSTNSDDDDTAQSDGAQATGHLVPDRSRAFKWRPEFLQEEYSQYSPKPSPSPEYQRSQSLSRKWVPPNYTIAPTIQPGQPKVDTVVNKWFTGKVTSFPGKGEVQPKGDLHSKSRDSSPTKIFLPPVLDEENSPRVAFLVSSFAARASPERMVLPKSPSPTRKWTLPHTANTLSKENGNDKAGKFLPPKVPSAAAKEWVPSKAMTLPIRKQESSRHESSPAKDKEAPKRESSVKEAPRTNTGTTPGAVLPKPNGAASIEKEVPKCDISDLKFPKRVVFGDWKNIDTTPFKGGALPGGLSAFKDAVPKKDSASASAPAKEHGLQRKEKSERKWVLELPDAKNSNVRVEDNLDDDGIISVTMPTDMLRKSARYEEGLGWVIDLPGLREATDADKSPLCSRPRREEDDEDDDEEYTDDDEYTDEDYTDSEDYTDVESGESDITCINKSDRVPDHASLDDDIHGASYVQPSLEVDSSLDVEPTFDDCASFDTQPSLDVDAAASVSTGSQSTLTSGSSVDENVARLYMDLDYEPDMPPREEIDVLPIIWESSFDSLDSFDGFDADVESIRRWMALRMIMRWLTSAVVVGLFFGYIAWPMFTNYVMPYFYPEEIDTSYWGTLKSYLVPKEEPVTFWGSIKNYFFPAPKVDYSFTGYIKRGLSWFW